MTVHNHPPYRPPCSERRVSGQLRGACLNDDGTPVSEPIGSDDLDAQPIALDGEPYRLADLLCASTHPDVRETCTGVFVGGDGGARFIVSCAGCKARARRMLKAEEALGEAAIIKLAPSDELLVEGNYFQRADLPHILGNHIRAYELASGEVKALYIRAKSAEAEVTTLRRQIAGLESRASAAEAAIEAVKAVHDDWHNRPLGSSAWPHVHHWLRDLRAALASVGGEPPATPDDSPASEVCACGRTDNCWGCIAPDDEDGTTASEGDDPPPPPTSEDYECCASGSCEVCRPGAGWSR